MSEGTQPRDAGNWAQPVERLTASNVPGGALDTVGGKQVLSPIQGFGRMWQKTYKVSLGTGVTPRQVIVVWKDEFPLFWPAGSEFHAPLTGIAPGEVALLEAAVGGGLRLSTGVLVLYADEESFTFMTPQGHMFAGWITFSAESAGDGTVVQAQVLMRASDPIYEIGMTLGGHRKEDKFWVATLRALGDRLGVPDAPITAENSCVDKKRQWRHAGSVWHNSMVRSVLQTIAAPVTALVRVARRGSSRTREEQAAPVRNER